MIPAFATKRLSYFVGFLSLLSAAFAIGLSLEPFRYLIESSMVWHMAVQMPMLVFTGWLTGQRFPQLLDRNFQSAFNQYGLTGMLIASFALAYWMLPLTIDRAIIVYRFDAFKIFSLILCGLILRDFFSRAHIIVQLFFLGYALSMLGTLGFYFATTDLRLCNAYTLDSQIRAGWALVSVTVLLGAAWVVHRFARLADLSVNTQ